MNHEQWSRDDMCVVCQSRPKFTENGIQHQYCGRTCAKREQPSSIARCRLSKCPKGGRAEFSRFCSEEHAQAAVRSKQVLGCVQCNVRPSIKGKLCAVCNSERQSRLEPRLEELDPRGKSFEHFSATIDSLWKPRPSGFKVAKVFKVINPQTTQDRYETAGQKLLSANSMPEILRTFHSSQCICDLGYLNSQCCDKPSCGICCILKSSFKSFAFGNTHNDGRHGKGIYSYQNPAHADRHATSCTSSPYRVVIACNVVMSQAKTSWFPQMQRVMSVSDEDGVFVTDADTIIAQHVILYTK